MELPAEVCSKLDLLGDFPHCLARVEWGRCPDLDRGNIAELCAQLTLAQAIGGFGPAWLSSCLSESP